MRNFFLFFLIATSLHLFADFENFGHVNKFIQHHDAHQYNYFVDHKNMGNEIIYQIFVDRFYNGNQQNDCLYDSRMCSPDHKDWFRYWGGDLRGVIEKISYLKELGITRLWLTPIFENQPVTVYRNSMGEKVEITSYHGYWFKDWFRLNPIFTDRGKDDLKIVSELIQKAQPHIKIYLDTAANHTSPSDATQDSINYLNSIEPLLPIEDVHNSPISHRGALFEKGRYLVSYSEDLFRTDHEKSYFPFFHHFASIVNYNDPFQVENFSLDGLADLDQSNPLVNDYLLRAHLFWLDQFPELAGFRMDTIKHVPLNFWQSFSEKLYSHKNDLEIIGEYYGGGIAQKGSQDFYTQTQMSMFDFQFRYLLKNIYLKNESYKKISEFWEHDKELGDAKNLITFIDNHDLARLRGEGVSFQQMKQMIAFWFAARGIPCIYYGLEQDLFYPNDPGDPYNRPMMKNFDTSSELFQWIKKLIAIRKENFALYYGDTHIIHETDDIFAFERIAGEQKIFFAMSKNPRIGSDNFNIKNSTFSDGVYKDILSGIDYNIKKGEIPVQLSQGEVILLKQ